MIDMARNAWLFNLPGSGSPATACECTVHISEDEEDINLLHIYVRWALWRRDLYVLLQHLILNPAILNIETLKFLSPMDER